MTVNVTPPQVFTLPQLNSEDPTMLTILTTHNYLQPVSKLNDLQTHLYVHNVPCTTTHLHPPQYSTLSTLTHHIIMASFSFISLAIHQ